MKNYAEQARAFMPSCSLTKYLGTDGFGRSDSRANLRRHFEVNAGYVVVASVYLNWLNVVIVEKSVVAEALAKFDIDTEQT